MFTKAKEGVSEEDYYLSEWTPEERSQVRKDVCVWPPRVGSWSKHHNLLKEGLIVRENKHNSMNPSSCTNMS